MKKLFFVALLLCDQVWAQPLVTFKISRAVGVLNFLQTASGGGHSSRTLYAQIWREAHGADSVRLAGMVARFRDLGLGFSYAIPGYPDSRPRPRSTDDLLMISAVQSSSVDDFMRRITGILPNETWLQLKQLMQGADPLYDKLVASGTHQAMAAQLAALGEYSPRLDDIFNRLSYFYNSTWTRDIPFTVAIYPIPGNKGNTTATPHSNSLVMAVLTGEQDHDSRIGVAVHEICHVLYGEQSMAFQQQFDGWFKASKDPNAVYGSNYIDEALATACGNAWTYEQLTGRTDTGEWYNDIYIDRFAHGIYPLVKEYMGKAKQIDSVFVIRAIATFSSAFPDAYRNYMNLLNSVNIYTNASGTSDWNDISRALGQEFRISSSSATWPIAEALQQLDDAKGTQLFVIHREHTATYKLLAAKFPELKSMSAAKEGVISFFDKRGRPVIIVNVKDKSRLSKGFAAMSKAREINKSKIFVGLE